MRYSIRCSYMVTSNYNELLSYTYFNLRELFFLEKNLRKIIISAMFLSLAVISATFIAIDIPLFGIKGLELNPSVIFYTFPALLFGPLYGGIVAGMTDALSFFLKPQGSFIPWISVVVFLGGVLKGFIWKGLKKFNDKKVRIVALVIVLVILASGLANRIMLLNDGVYKGYIASERNVVSKDTVDNLIEEGKASYATKAAAKLSIYAKEGAYKSDFSKSINYLTIGFEVASLLGLILLFIDFLISRFDAKKGRERKASYIKVLIAVLIPGLFVTTLNTQVLIWFISIFNTRSFMIMWLLRIIPSFLSHTIQAYYVAILYDVYVKYSKGKK